MRTGSSTPVHPMRTTAFAAACEPSVSSGPSPEARGSFTGGFPRSAFLPQPDETLLCPASHYLFFPENDTHSENMLKGWGLYIIRNNLHNVPAGSTINMLIFTQVKVCPPCRKAIQTWAKQLQQAAPAGVRVNLYIWQQTNFDINHPDQTPVRSANEVECAVSSSAL